MKAIEKNQREGGGGGGGGDEKPSFLKFSWKAGDSRTSRNSSGVQVKPAKSLSHRYPDDDVHLNNSLFALSYRIVRLN